MIGRVLLTVAAGVVAVSCSSGSGGPQFGVPDGEAIQQLVADYAAAYSIQDVDALEAMFAGTISLMPPNSSTVRGTESVAGFFNALFANAQPELEMESVARGGSGGLAFAQGTYRTITQVPVATEGDGEDGEDDDENADEAEVEMTESRDRGKWLLIARKLLGEWRIDHLIWNSDLPPPTDGS